MPEECYMTERITNIADLEALVNSAYIRVRRICDLLEKENPPMCEIGELARQAHLELLQAHNFDFCIERRIAKVVMDT